MLTHVRRVMWTLLALVTWIPAASGAPPTPSGPHPRLFLVGANLDRVKNLAQSSGTVSKAIVARCQQTIDSPQSFADRGGAGGGIWPDAAVSCAFAYQVTQKAAYAAQAVKYWRAALNDDQAIGDGLGCVPGVSTDWQSWKGGGPVPPVIITITHDTGYPMRWYGPYVALTYDWMHDAPGVDEALRAQTRTCLTAWVDYYSQRGYMNAEPGANYNAGFVAGKTLAAVAMGGENGPAGDRLWSEVVDGVFGKLLVGTGLAGAGTPLGTPVGVLLGGDWGEGWQYGPLSVLEYAAATRVVEEYGAAQPDLDAWTNSLILRYVHGTVPRLDGQWVGGDFEGSSVYQSPTMNALDAVLLGPSSDLAAGWAAEVKRLQAPERSTFIWNALAELRPVTPSDYRSQTPPPPLWYIARGTRALYARTSWGPDAFWAVFSSPPQVVSDHHHFAAGNFVFTRGADHLVVDSSNYGEPGTLETNAIGVDSPGVPGDYAPSQTPWSKAELVWARGTDTAVFAARSDFAKAFAFSGQASDVSYARRDWVLLPEGEIVTVDRVHTSGPTYNMYLNFHTNTGGTLALSGTTATGTVGASRIAIRPVLLSGGTPYTFRPLVKNDYTHPCGACTKARFAVDAYALKVPGPWAVAIHVIDGLGASEAQATVGSLNDEAYDPAPKRNGGVVGAAVYRASRQSYVVASSGVDGQVGAAMSYAVPGGSASRHVVFDAPEDAAGQSVVTTSVDGGRCAIRIEAGTGMAGRPLMFMVGTADAGCPASASTDVPPGAPPPGGGVGPLHAVPAVKSFTATPLTVPAGGGQVTLSWLVTDADTVTIDHGVGTVTGTSAAASVTTDTTFTLTASNAYGTATATAAVAIAPSGAPTIVSFAATPATLPAGGGTVTLAWQVTGADSLTIAPGVGTVAGQSTTVRVTSATTFTLAATNASGTATARAEVAVAPSSGGGATGKASGCSTGGCASSALPIAAAIGVPWLALRLRSRKSRAGRSGVGQPAARAGDDGSGG
jgi:hypothetical protein